MFLFCSGKFVLFVSLLVIVCRFWHLSCQISIASIRLIVIRSLNTLTTVLHFKFCLKYYNNLLIFNAIINWNFIWNIELNNSVLLRFTQHLYWTPFNRDYFSEMCTVHYLIFYFVFGIFKLGNFFIFLCLRIVAVGRHKARVRAPGQTSKQNTKSISSAISSQQIIGKHSESK